MSNSILSPLDELKQEKIQHHRLFKAYHELAIDHSMLQNKYIDLWLEKKYADASAQKYKEMASQVAQTNPYAIA